MTYRFIHIFHDRGRICDQKADGLGRVNSAAPTNGHIKIKIIPFQVFGHLINGLVRGFHVDIVIDLRTNPFLLNNFLYPVWMTGHPQILVGADEGPFCL